MPACIRPSRREAGATPRKQVGDFPSDHVLDDTGNRRLAGDERRDARPVAQDGDAIGNREHFVEFVGNVDAGSAVGARKDFLIPFCLKNNRRE